MQEPIGIIDLCTYFPTTTVDIQDLERYDGVPSGKYHLGLGQNRMAFVTDREDVVSLALTALNCLLTNAKVPYSDIGRLEVGTETAIDRSKSIKSRLMQLFESAGNFEVEGLDSTNGCYGGTAALFNSIAWLESSACDGRLAVVVCSDVAVYAPGPARATGGAGATAMLVGKGSRVRIALEHRLRATHMENTYDFFKPNGASQYPTVNGPATVECYTRGIDRTYGLWKNRASRADGTNITIRSGAVDYVLFHTPFNKMVRKAMGRLLWHDMEHSDGDLVQSDTFFDVVRHWRGDLNMRACRNRDATKAFETLAAQLYTEKAEHGAWLARETGNMYTASLYSSLNALVVRQGASLVGKRILLYSFGSGMAASMFSMRVVSWSHDFGNSAMLNSLLMERRVDSAELYTKWMAILDDNWNRFGYRPTYDPHLLQPNVFYLDHVQSNASRIYKQNVPQTSTNGIKHNHKALKPP